ncbi:MAG TPA: glycoside hydrolase family 38 C-terminal domain-containing protein [Candidatus Cybelea sp.]|nr:glycoside hydrolase family 38 C-terminal domain-containing protein [Candidatus Cybelea sp.]
MKKIVLYPFAVCLLCPILAIAQTPSGKAKQEAKLKEASAQAAAPKSAANGKPAQGTHGVAKLGAAPDLAKQPILYVVAYAHLDTQWRWEYPQVISEYLTKTMRNNFSLFEKYPHYIFNFTGANRYRLMKEYYPADFARLKQYVATGRWYPAGSSMEEGDVNAPSAEAIIRQVLYGNNWFRKEFGKASAEFMLPDCFGFPASLPTILAHAGIKGFSTQKLSAAWQPAPHVGGPDSPEKTPEGIPFNVGVWEGPDGSTVLAALNPLSYGSNVDYDLSKTPPSPLAPPANAPANFRVRPFEDWTKRIQINGDLTGVFADYHYVGTGDTGGSPTENSVNLMEAIETKSTTVIPPIRFNFFGRGQQEEPPSPPPAPVKVGDGPVHVTWSNADQMFLDILKCCKIDRMPRYKGDLELINHSAGSLTSEAYHKRWNRKNELLAAAAEESSVAADWLGGRPYPQKRLTDAWTLVMGGHFHDNMAGTSTPKAYEFTWNDDVIAMNQFASVLTSATAAVASGMDTQASGTAIVVYNPLNVARGDVVEAVIEGAPPTVRVIGPDGKEVPAQAEAGGKVLFVAQAPSVGYAVYDVQPGTLSAASELRVSESSLENARYRVQIDQNGDVSGIFDKKLNRELLSGPIRLAMSTDNPRQWPAWNMDFEDEQRAPRSYVSGPTKVRVTENGPARIAVEVTRDTEDSHFVETIRLSAGDAGNRVEFANAIDWKTKEANLKATFPLAANNRMATYNWDIGTIQRPNEDERQFEVASHQWIDLTDQGGAFGVTILTDCKNASDKPNDNTLRLTLVRTPGTRGGYPDQGSQDLGHHEFVFGLVGHAGDWREEQTDWQAYRLNQPLIAFASERHGGRLGKQFSLLKLNSDRVRLLALKKAELPDEVIVRIVELDGKAQPKVAISFPSPIASAREVNGQEQPVGSATLHNALITSLGAYQPRSFALKLGPAPARLTAPQSQPIPLQCDLAAATTDGRPAEGSFDILPNNPSTAQGRALPAEMLPRDVEFAGIHFTLAPAGNGRPNALLAKGQTIKLPQQHFNRVYVLAAAVGDQVGTFRAGDRPVQLNIQNWTGFIGQWDDRTWNTRQELVQSRPGQTLPPNAPRVHTVEEFSGTLIPGFIKRADVAWYSSHRHAPDGSNEPYAYAYLFAYPIDLPVGAKTLTLPDNDRIRILAISVADEAGRVTPAQPLYDTLERTDSETVRPGTGNAKVASN